MDSAVWQNLFLDQELSDVHLHIYMTTEDRELVVPSHNLVLRSAGKSFSVMLDNAKVQENRTRKVELRVKGDANVTFTFLRYLYTKELEDVDLSTYIYLLQTAHLYELGELAELCEERIADKMTPHTVCKVYSSVKSLASERFKNRCLDLMMASAFLIFWKNLHLSLDENTMALLLTMDRSSFLDERQIEGALCRWGYARKAFDCEAEENVEKQISSLRLLTEETSTESLHKRKKLRFPWSSIGSQKNRKTASDNSEARDKIETFTIKTEPRSGGRIIKFAEICCLSEVSQDHSKVTFLGKKTHLMNISVKRNVLLAGFTIQIKETGIFGFLVSHADVSFNLHGKKLIVSDYSKVLIAHVDEDTIFSDLRVTLRTPVLLQKAQPNLLTIDVDPKADYNSSLTAYVFTNLEGNSPDSGKTGPFLDQDENIAVRELLYFE